MVSSVTQVSRGDNQRKNPYTHAHVPTISLCPQQVLNAAF